MRFIRYGLCLTLACGVDVATPSLIVDAAPPGADSSFEIDAGTTDRDHNGQDDQWLDAGTVTPVADAGSTQPAEDSGPPPAREDDHGNTIDTGTSVELGSSTAGRINYEEDIDVFLFRTTRRGEYRIATEGRVDTFCALYTSDGRPLYSNDNGGSRQNCEIIEDLNANGDYAVAVRHFDPDSSGGQYSLVVEGPLSQREPVCGNAIVEVGEQCDDGNRRNGDGCDNRCQWEDDEPELPNGCRLINERNRRTAICWQPRNRAAAAQHCESAGMTLVTIDDERDNAILFQASNQTSPWIGLSDQRREGEWVWDSRTSGYVNWNVGEPNNWGNNEDCVQITISGRWNDANCNQRLMFFCEDPR